MFYPSFLIWKKLNSYTTLSNFSFWLKLWIICIFVFLTGVTEEELRIFPFFFSICRLTRALQFEPAPTISVMGRDHVLATNISLTPLNLQSSGNPGPLAFSGLLTTHLEATISKCMKDIENEANGKQNVPTSCEFLANMCVMSFYDLQSDACSAYWKIFSTQLHKSLSNSATTPDLSTVISENGGVLEKGHKCEKIRDCETVDNFPWLYFLRSSAFIREDLNSFSLAKVNQLIQLQIVAYDWSGNIIGTFENSWNSLLLCPLAPPNAMKFWKTSRLNLIRCFLHPDWFSTLAPLAEFWELNYLNPDTQEWIPVPVLQRYQSTNIDPKNYEDTNIFIPEAKLSVESDGDITIVPVTNGLHRRFYLYDNIVFNSGTDIENRKNLQYVTLATSLALVFSQWSLNKSVAYIDVPTLIINYAAYPTLSTVDQVLASDQNDIADLRSMDEHLVANSWIFSKSVLSVRAVVFQQVGVNFQDRQLVFIISLPLLAITVLLLAWYSAYCWSRRAQNSTLHPFLFFRYTVYALNHWGNVVLICTLLYAFVCYLRYRNQTFFHYILPLNSLFLFAIIISGTIAKGLAVWYALFEQCNADYFVVDWERSRGLLAHENTTVPIVMWRSIFLVNQLSKMQTLRSWNLIFVIILIIFCGEQLHVFGFSRISKEFSDDVHHQRGDEVYSSILRVAVGGFLWTTTVIFMHFISSQVYFRFFKDHPLLMLKDLCSVTNLSIFIFLESQWGYYIHGESIHAHADVNALEFLHNLEEEAQGNLPSRSLGGQKVSQVCEIFASPQLRYFVWFCYNTVARGGYLSLDGSSAGSDTVSSVSMRRHCFSCLKYRKGKFRFAPSKVALDIKNHIQLVYQNCVRGVESSLLRKSFMHKWFSFPPNIVFMNGVQHHPTSVRDIFFFDKGHGYSKAFLYNLGFDLYVLYTLLFLCVDMNIFNIYWSMFVVLCLDALIWVYRKYEGEANLSTKTLTDTRFFL